eukprot:gene21110-biopygen17638
MGKEESGGKDIASRPQPAPRDAPRTRPGTRLGTRPGRARDAAGLVGC